MLPTRLLEVTHPALTAEDVEGRLRAFETPVVARIQDDRVVVDLRTVLEDEDEVLVRALNSIPNP